MKRQIIVFVKQVPDTKNVTGDAMTPEGTVNRAALPAIFNPEDLNALELGLELKDKYGYRVIVATMGPPNAAAVLREALYRGADEAILLTDRAFAGADTLATSYALSCCAKTVGNYDLILCGRQAIDGDTAQVGPQLAEKLDIPQICYTQEVLSIDKGEIRARRAIDGGYEILESKLPVLLTVIDANEPRSPSAKRIMKYKKSKTLLELKKTLGNSDYLNEEKLVEEEQKLRKKDLWINEWDSSKIKADPARIGMKGSPTKVKQIESVILTATETIKVEPTERGVSDLIYKLIEDHTLG